MNAAAFQVSMVSECADSIARKAAYALYSELALYPKPGLVSPIDSGAHTDMSLSTFIRSLSAIRGYYREIARAGARQATFAELQQLGIAAEHRMLGATGGVNTHRGAIFSLGLLAAAAGFLRTRRLPLVGSALGVTVSRLWRADMCRARPDPDSHGTNASRQYRVGGARQQAADGFPILFDIAVPTMQSTLRAMQDERRACIQTLFALMAELDDTNLLHRDGTEGLAFVKAHARAFLAAGGVYADDWLARAIGLHRACIRRWLSPGGAADLLAAAIFVRKLQAES